MPRLCSPLLLIAACACLAAAAPQPAAAHQTGHQAAAPRAAEAAPVTEQAVARGSLVFQAHCAICHLSDSRQAKVGPGLKGLFAREKTPVLGHPVSEAAIREHISRGSRNMPAFGGLPEPDMDALLAYLRSL